VEPVVSRHWYHILMKLFLALALSAFAASAQNPQLKQVNTVYILSMGGGMDMFLANHLTALHVFQVVTDPQKADAILTDRLGEVFEDRLKELYPPPAPPKVEEKDKDKDDKSAKGKDWSGSDIPKPRASSFNRGKGNLFIVDRKSRTVIWSIYEEPKGSSPGDLDKVADKIVKHLKNDLIDKNQSE